MTTTTNLGRNLKDCDLQFHASLLSTFSRPQFYQFDLTSLRIFPPPSPNMEIIF